MSMKKKKEGIKKASTARTDTPGLQKAGVKPGSNPGKTPHPVSGSMGMSLGTLIDRTRAFFRPAQKAEAWLPLADIPINPMGCQPPPAPHLFSRDRFCKNPGAKQPEYTVGNNGYAFFKDILLQMIKNGFSH
jgi:hypothetical protein